MGTKETGVRPAILLGDGKTDHMGKELAGMLSEQSTHTRSGKLVPDKSVSSTLFELSEKAKRDRTYRFRSLYREIDYRLLHESFWALKRKAACGVDGVTWDEYEMNLEENLKDLLGRLANHRYRARIIRRKHIPKGNGKTRPLGIPALEDKIVQMSARKLLEAIYEVDFLDCSMGYRPNRSARRAGRQLRDELFLGRCHWVVEADIKGFFDNMNHEELVEMLKQRINDGHFIRLIQKWLSAGIMEEDGVVINPTTGTPQGGIISPILANIYLHNVMDLWIDRVVRKQCRGQVIYQRYAGDFIVAFEYGNEAEGFFELLPKRLEKFNLCIAPEKSGILRFSRCDPQGSKHFTYLGFDFYWAHTRNRKLTIRRRTNKKKYQAALGSIQTWLNKEKHNPIKVLKDTLGNKLRGHFNYYGVIGNSRMLSNFYNDVRWIVYRILNNRSQKKSYNWTGFCQMWNTLNLPKPKILEQYTTSKSKELAYA